MKHLIVKTEKNRKVPNKRELTASLICDILLVFAKFLLNTCVDSENGKVNIYIKHFGLGVLVVSDLNLLDKCHGFDPRLGWECFPSLVHLVHTQYALD